MTKGDVYIFGHSEVYICKEGIESSRDISRHFANFGVPAICVKGWSYKCESPRVGRRKLSKCRLLHKGQLEYVRKVGWDGKLVNESYPWVEKLVIHRPPLRQWQTAIRDAPLDVGILPDNGFTYDHMYGTKVGGTIFDDDRN
eukprot:Gb_37597 [translate_table: standard]